MAELMREQRNSAARRRGQRAQIKVHAPITLPRSAITSILGQRLVPITRPVLTRTRFPPIWRARLQPPEGGTYFSFSELSSYRRVIKNTLELNQPRLIRQVIRHHIHV